MANLQGKKISNTYEGLIKTENNSAVSGATVLTDGAGNSLQITVNTDGTLTAQTVTASNLNVSNWDEAYSWGDHSLSGYATSSDVANAVNDVINAAPSALDTLDELAAALGDDANFATTITNLITGVSDRVTVLENAGFVTTDTQLTDAEIAAMGYIKVDTNTQRTDAEIDARIALNPEGFITSYVDTNTQLTDAEIAAMGYIKTDTQLTDAEIAALGYIKTDTNTQRTDAEIDARIALNPEGFITSYVDTNTQLSDADIAAMGYIKTDTNTQLSDSDIAAMGYIKTDTNTQRTDAEIDARIALNPEGFLTSETDSQTLTFNNATGDLAISNGNTVNIPDTNTQLSDADIAAFGYIKTDTNTQRTDSEINALIALNPEGFLTSETDSQTLTYTSATGDLTISNGNTVNIPDNNTQLSDADIAAFGYIKTDTNTQRTDSEINALIDANTNNFISDYTVTESDVTAHEGAITITESQISDLSHFSGSYNDLTDKPSGVNPRTDEEIEDVVGAAISGSGATSVVYNDAAGTIVVSSTDTNTQLTDAEIAAFGYIKTDTNTQLTDAEIAAMGYIKVDTNTQLTDAEIAAFGYVKTDTQLSDADIAAFGYIKTDTNTQRTDAEIQAIIDANSAGFITTYVDTNTQLSDADIAAMGYIKTDTNTQLSDSDIAAFGYIKTDTNTQRTDAEINALITTGISGLATETYVDNAVSNLVDTAPAALDTLNELAAALGDDPNFATTVSTNIGNVSSRVTTLENANYISDYTVTQGDVTAHQSALTITESQISDLSHFSGSYNDLTDKPAGVNPRTDEEIEDVVGSLVSGTGATTVTYNDTSGTLVINSTDTNTQLGDADIAAFGYIKTDTNTQLSDADIAAFGYIKTDTNTQRTDAEIDARIALNPEGFITSYVDTNTQLSDADIAAFGYIKTDTNTQLSDSDIAAFGYVKTDTQLTDSEIAAFGYIKTDTNTQRTDAEINALINANTNNYISDYTVTEGDVTAHESALTITQSQISDLSSVTARTDEEIRDVIGAAISGTGATTVTVNDAANTIVVSSTDTNTQLSDADIAAFGYIKTDTNTQLSDADIAAFGYIKTDTNTQLSDAEIAAFGYIKTDTNTQRTDAEIISVAETEGFTKDALPLTGGALTGDLSIDGSISMPRTEEFYWTDPTSGSPRAVIFSTENEFTGDYNGMGFSVAADGRTAPSMYIRGTGNVGIGTTNPSYKLEVNGNAQFEDYIRITNSSGSQNILFGNQDSSGANNPSVISGANGNTYIGGGNSWNTNGGTLDYTATFLDNGNVGISETSPDTFLHVTKNELTHSWTANSNNIATFENSAGAHVNIVSGSSNTGELWFSDADLQARGRLRYDHFSDRMEIWGASTPKAYFYSTGDVTITGNLTENSDAKLKENVSTIDNALDKVNSLRGVEYNMIADENKTKKIGFIAQEVEEVAPELVFDNGEVKSVAYSNTVALLVESIKELTDKVTDLQGQIDAMRAQ